MTDKEWEMFERSTHFVKTMGPTYVGIVDHDVLIAAHKELEEQRSRFGCRELEVCTRCNGGCPDKEHPVVERWCAECYEDLYKRPIELLQGRVAHLEKGIKWAIDELIAYGHVSAASRLHGRIEGGSNE